MNTPNEDYDKLYRDNAENNTPASGETPPNYVAVPPLVGAASEAAMLELEQLNLSPYFHAPKILDKNGEEDTTVAQPGVATLNGRTPLALAGNGQNFTGEAATRIVKQDPEPGAKVAPGTTVHLHWSYVTPAKKSTWEMLRGILIGAVVSILAILAGAYLGQKNAEFLPSETPTTIISPTIVVPPVSPTTSESPTVTETVTTTPKPKPKPTVTVTETVTATPKPKPTATVTETVTATPKPDTSILPTQPASADAE